MAKFKVTKSDRKGKAWKATGTVDGKTVTVHGGDANHRGNWGVAGGKSPEQVKAFLARHGEPKNVKQYINRLNWKRGSVIGKIIEVPKKFL